MPSIYIKVVGIDADFDELPYEGDPTIQELKTMVLAAKTGRLVGLAPSDLKVYNGESESVTGRPLARIQSRLSSHPDPSFVIVPASGTLSSVSKVSGKIPSSILAPKRDTSIPKSNVDIKLIPYISPDSKIRQLLDRPIDVTRVYPVEETVAPDGIIHFDPNYRSRFGQSVALAAESFTAKSQAPPTYVEYKTTGTQLSESSPIKRVLDMTTGVYIEVAQRPEEKEYELIIPTDLTGSFKTILEPSIGAKVHMKAFEIPVKVEKPIQRDLASELGTTSIKDALKRMGGVNMDSLVHQDIKRDPHELVWIALGTMSTGETFHGVEFADVESYCTEHLTCFESTRLHNPKKFFIDIDGFTPTMISRQQFNEVDSHVLRTIHRLFNRTASILTSSRYLNRAQRVGPIGTNLVTTKNKLSYRVIFKKLYGSLEAMDYWLMREILPKLKAELAGVCTVTEQEETEKIQVPDKIPVVILDRWNYYGGERMRMMGSSKEHENRPLVPVGDITFMDTVLAYIPPGSIRLPERMQSNGATRVPIWEPL